MFQDDSNFRKAKRALLITSSIALLMSLTNLEINELNLVLVKFSFDRPLVIYIFITIVSLYQSIILYNRGRNYFSQKQLEENKEIEKTFQAGKSPDDFELFRDSIIKDLNKVLLKVDDRVEQFKIKPRLDYGWKTPQDVEASEKVDEKDIDEFLKLTSNAQLIMKRKEVVEKIVKDEKIVYSVSIYDKFFDFYLPLVYAALSSIILIFTLFQNNY